MQILRLMELKTGLTCLLQLNSEPSFCCTTVASKVKRNQPFIELHLSLPEQVIPSHVIILEA